MHNSYHGIDSREQLLEPGLQSQEFKSGFKTEELDSMSRKEPEEALEQRQLGTRSWR